MTWRLEKKLGHSITDPPPYFKVLCRLLINNFCFTQDATQVFVAEDSNLSLG